MPTTPTASALRARAAQALGPDPTALLTPPLPAAWPDAGGRVVFLRYTVEALGSSLDRARLSSAPHQAVVDVATGTARKLDLAGAGPLGEEEASMVDGPDEAALAKAEQALVDVVAGRRPAEGARADLRAYVRWLEAQPLIAVDLAKRHAAFVAWLRAR